MPHDRKKFVSKFNWKPKKKTKRNVNAVKKKIFSFSDEPKTISNKMLGVNTR